MVDLVVVQSPNGGGTGIPDFRGPDGAWTLRAQGRQRTSKTVSTLQAIPTPTHMALAELSKRGILTYLVSQNCDGLHRKSGIHPVRWMCYALMKSVRS